MSDETIAILRRGHHAFSRGDTSVALDLVTPDVEWGATGAFPGLEGTYRGRDSIQDWVDTVRTELHPLEPEIEPSAEFRLMAAASVPARRRVSQRAH
ncbi:MAG: hypothetical protein ABWZ63_06375, partial [Thermoleophilaceae bacterium]